MRGHAQLADGLGERTHDFLDVDAAGHVVAHALLRVFVDEGEYPEGAAHGRYVGEEVPRPDLPGLQGHGRHAARREAHAHPLALG